MKFIIYKDDDMKIEVDSHVLNFFNSFMPKTLSINSYFLRILHGYVADTLLTKNMARETFKLSTPREVYVLKYNEGLALPEPFDYFEAAIDIIDSDVDFLEHPKFIESKVNEYYNSENFYCEIFEEPVFDVRGFLSFVDGNVVHVILFAYEED